MPGRWGAHSSFRVCEAALRWGGPSLRFCLLIAKTIHAVVISNRGLPFILPCMLDKELSYTTSDGVKEGTVVLRLVGPFTLSNMFELQSELRTIKPARLIMDLTEVPYMDSAGLGVIMNYYVSAQSCGRKFFLTGINARIHALLEMTKVDVVLNTCDSVETAQTLV
jgi:anti-anti-sigma factor